MQNELYSQKRNENKMNPILIAGAISAFSKNKSLQYLGIFAILYVFFSLKNAVNYITDLPENILSEINDFISGRIVLSDSALQNFENKTGINKFFSSSWYLQEQYKNPNNPNKISGNMAYNFATEFKSADGFFNDNEELVYDLLAQLPNKISLGFVAHNFKTIYGQDLITFLRSILSNLELMKCYEIIAIKPVK